MARKRRKKPKILNTFADFIKKITDYEYTLQYSEYYCSLLKSLKSCCAYIDIGDITQILCFGIGHFTECMTSKYQLAMLLLLKRHYNVPVQIYDPVFSETELDFLEKLDMNCIKENEGGARLLEPNTLVFLPHCPNGLLNNLLWRNWNPNISKCIIFGNSIKFLAENQTTGAFKDEYHFIYSIFPHTRELEVENNFKFSDIFNDMSLHIFPPDVINDLPVTFWDPCEKVLPSYLQNTDFITNKLQNIDIKKDKE